MEIFKTKMAFIALVSICAVMIVLYKKAFLVNMTLENDFTAISLESCAEWKEPDWAEITPLIILRGDKFLYPQLIWGPNNQILGLIQSIYLSIRLNRTMVLPLMHTDLHNEKLSNYPTYQRIDVDSVRRFLSVISVEEMKKKCNNTFGVGFMSHSPVVNSVKRMAKSTNMTLFAKRKYSESRALLLANGTIANSTTEEFLPVFLEGKSKLISTTENLRKIFPSQAACAVHISSFNYIKVKIQDNIPTPLQPKSVCDIPSISDDVLYSACAEAVRHSPPLVQMARSFVERTSRGKIAIAIHWRYDVKDWQQAKCDPKKQGKTVNKMCKNIKRIGPRDLLLGAMEKMKNVLEPSGQNISDIGLVYLAIPPELAKTFAMEFNNISAAFFSSMTSATQVELQEYAEKNNCSRSWQSMVEILSVLEMEICTNSEVFFFSAGSSWSKNVNMLRAASNLTKNFGIFEVATKAMIKRIA